MEEEQINLDKACDPILIYKRKKDKEKKDAKKD
ncbi:hypothetical protein LCGC14_0732060 [marine sediment metagenome]|uniref:Uncharacterized protein n=1 Tax=marine sediment metagenome TaxID=412755 RepID=A0A0F9Q9A5_9ZZZZ